MATLRPTFSESWYRVAELKAKLRPSAQISRQFYRGDRWYVVRDPAGNQFHRLSAPAYRFVGLLNGTRTVAEAWELVGGQLADDAPTQNEVIQILSQLHSANLIESNVSPDAAVLLRRHKKMVQRQWQGRLMNILFPRIPLWDCDVFLKRWMPVMRIFISKFGALLWLAVMITAGFMLAPQWAKLRSGAEHAIDPANWPFLWASFVLIKAIHELGHGFICRRFGGEVHDMGVMFLVLVPAPYVDASTAWAFHNKWQRILVGAGGMIFELFVAAIMAFVWLNTQPGTLVNGLAYNIMLIASVSTVIFNANPLLRYDGYYMLADWLEIPNLRYRSSEYSMGLIKRHLFRVKSPQPLPPPGQRVWLFVYAIASTFYRTLVGIAIIFMVWERVPVLGVLMALGGVITWLLVPVIKTCKYLLIDPELHRKRGRATAWVLGFAAAVVIAVGVIPFPVRYETSGIVEPYYRDSVFVPEIGGYVKQIMAWDGKWVHKGDDLLVLSNYRLEKEIDALRAEIQSLESRKDDATFKDVNDAMQLEAQIKGLQKRLEVRLWRQQQLVIKSPREGQLVAPELKNMMGKYLQPGEEIGMVARFEKLLIPASIDQSNAALAYLQKGRTADVRLAGRRGEGGLTARIEEQVPTPRWELRHASEGQAGGGDARVDPQDPKGLKLLRPHTEVRLEMDNPGDIFVAGQRAYLRFELDKKPLIWNWSRWVRQVIQSHSNTKWM